MTVHAAPAGVSSQPADYDDHRDNKLHATDQATRTAVAETLAGIKSEVADVGVVYSVRCSFVIDHGYGRLSILARLDPQQSVMHLDVSSLSADFEQSPSRKYTLAVADIIPLLTGTPLLGYVLVSVSSKKPAWAENQLPERDRF